MKSFLIFILFLSSSALFSQKELDQYHTNQKKLNQYKKDLKITPIEDWGTVYPNYEEFDDSEDTDKEVTEATKESVSKENIESDRIKRYGEHYGKGASKKPNPKILPPDPIELPEVKLPKVKLPEVDLPDINLSGIGTWDFWRKILLVIIVCALLIILYLIVKRYLPKDSKVKLEIDDEWNPTLVSKSELELKLEKLHFNENYRECIRVHFMFILKELINLQLIDWKVEKTNHDYLNEVIKSKGYDDFSKCIRIYDLVWYGDYEIDKKQYDELRPMLENYYKKLLKTNE
ncbi:MAG: hypothetical protein M9916_12160 [Crocinitomicaceae bacterium]|nr:hypothetical protein [Crocinitomicaceae bacterium]